VKQNPRSSTADASDNAALGSSFCTPAAQPRATSIDDPEFRRRETIRMLNDLMKVPA
jgi:hypothetical protein